MLNFNSVLIFSEDPEKLRDFYKRAFQKDPDMGEGGYYGFAVGTAFITIGPHDKVKGKASNPERIMLNLETNDVEKEFERIEKLGAEVIAKPYSMEGMEEYVIATLADPDGNYFQLVTPWESDGKN